MRLADVGAAFEQLRGQSHGNVRGAVVGQQSQPRSGKPRPGGRLAQQNAHRKPRLLHGAAVLRNVRLGGVDQAPGLLQRHAVGHAVAEHRVDQRGRFAPQPEGLAGDREVAFILQQREVGRGDLGGQREPDARQSPLRGRDFGLCGPFGVAQRPEQRQFPREGRFDGIRLHDLRLGRIFALGGGFRADLRQVLRPYGLEVGPGLLDARGRYGHVAVVRQRLFDQRVKRRVAEEFPPAFAHARRVGREARAVDVTFGRRDLRRVEFRGAGGQRQHGGGYRKLRFHAFSSCFLSSRRCSKRPIFPTK